MSPRRKHVPPPGEELTPRQQFLLFLIVREHIDTGQPVGSSYLVRRHRLNFSAATVRHEMAVLSAKGYLTQPHPSAGRVPTRRGYRFFAERLLERSDLPPEAKHTIAHQFYQAQQDIDQWMPLAAAVLARQARAAAVVTSPHAAEVRYKHLELIGIRGRRVLMVLVLMGGEVRQRLLTLDAPVPQARLSAVADRLNTRLYGRSWDTLRALPPFSEPLAATVFAAVLEEMEEAGRRWVEEVYRDGLSHVLSDRAFASPEEARQALAILEDRGLLEHLLQRLAEQAEVGRVQVLVGSEEWEALRPCAVVVARYGNPTVATGMVGVVGPTRMAYNRAIPAVRFVARLLSDMMTETLAE